MKILLLDNYDSFTYNLVHLLEQFEEVELTICRNDKIALDEIGAFDKIVLSPGPGLPIGAGIMMDLVKKYAPTKSILGICLGHQALAQAFGAKLVNIEKVMHGIATKTIIKDKNEKLFHTLPATFSTGRYHSWMVDTKELPSTLTVTAEDEEGRIMAISHSSYDVKGLQFHPESILTEYGKEIIKNWLRN